MTARLESGPGCMFCGRQDVSKDALVRALAAGTSLLCGRCRKELCPTPLDQVLGAAGMSDQEFADLTGMPVRTIARASKGAWMSRKVAARLAKITGLPAWRFQPEAA